MSLAADGYAAGMASYRPRCLRYTRAMARRGPGLRLAVGAPHLAAAGAAALLAAALWLPSCSHAWDDFDPRLKEDGVGIGGAGGSGGAASSGGGGPGPTSTTSSSASAGGGGAGSATCGDGIVDGAEQCDDENGVAGDGCDACQVECDGSDHFLDLRTLHCYRFAPAATWQASVQACEAWGGHLSAITDAAEMAFVLEHVTEQTWIGASELDVEDTWVWVSGEPWDYTPWLMNEPNEGGNQGGGGAGGGVPYEEDCLELYDEVGAVEGFGFADDGCGHEQQALCERWPAGSQR